MGEDRRNDKLSAQAESTGPTEGAIGHTRTPLYAAINADRYGRQNRIREIQEATGRRLICYVSGPLASLTRDDALPLVDLLHVIPPGSDIELLLHTPGGEIDAAEKMANMIRRHVGDGSFRVVVPDFAKSAGTLLCLAADIIVMSESSELGPIDPQVRLPDGNGQYAFRPALSYVDAYNSLIELVNKQPDAVAYRQMLNKYEPALVDLCNKVILRSRKLAEELLQKGMFKTGGAYTYPAYELSRNDQWLVHSAPIDYIEAKRLQLNVDYMEPTTTLWQSYWALYCEQRLAIKPDDCKLFESDYVSLPMA